MSTAQRTMTADELLALGDIGRCELIDGELVPMSPSGFRHGAVAMTIGSLLAEYVRARRLGVTTAAETGFRIRKDPDTVRAPDAAFISAERTQAAPSRGFFEGAPDLAVEVVSPEDRWSDVGAKAEDWLKGGSRLVWIVDPANRCVTVYQVGEPVRVLHEAEVLMGDPVIPGFRVPVREIFISLE